MDKWADYGINAVKYNGDHTAIVEVKAKPDNGDNFGAEERLKRDAVVKKIKGGWTFVTIILKNAKWTKGASVDVIKVGGDEFLRTDRNSVKKDNLGELPEYE